MGKMGNKNGGSSVKAFFTIAAYLVLGLAAGAGIRAAEWLIPKPETRFVICMAYDMDKPVCEDLDKIINKK